MGGDLIASTHLFPFDVLRFSRLHFGRFNFALADRINTLLVKGKMLVSVVRVLMGRETGNGAGGKRRKFN